jgi:hypothetical protein
MPSDPTAARCCFNARFEDQLDANLSAEARAEAIAQAKSAYFTSLSVKGVRAKKQRALIRAEERVNELRVALDGIGDS